VPLIVLGLVLAVRAMLKPELASGKAPPA
jgi:hypothetical protein